MDTGCGTDGRTDGQTDGQTDGRSETSIPPQQLCCIITKKIYFFIQENACENVVCQTEAILPQPQCIKWTGTVSMVFIVIQAFITHLISEKHPLCIFHILNKCCITLKSSFVNSTSHFNTLRQRQNGRPFADDVFKRIFFNENYCILIQISLEYVPRGPIINMPALVCQTGNKPLSEPKMA